MKAAAAGRRRGEDGRHRSLLPEASNRPTATGALLGAADSLRSCAFLAPGAGRGALDLKATYDQFGEGQGTDELQDARALMETLRQAIDAKQPQRSERESELDAAMPASVLKFNGAVAGGAKWARGLSFSAAAPRTSH